MEAVEAIIAMTVLIIGLWFISPFYRPSTSVSAKIWESASVAEYTGLAQALVAAILLLALVRKGWAIRQTVRRLTTFAIFVLYLFYGFSSTMILGLGRVSWVATFALSLIAGVAHIRLKWEEGQHA